MVTSLSKSLIRGFGRFSSHTFFALYALLAYGCSTSSFGNNMRHEQSPSHFQQPPLHQTHQSHQQRQRLIDFDAFFNVQKNTYSEPGYKVLSETFDFAEKFLLCLYGTEAEKEKCLFCTKENDPSLFWSWEEEVKPHCCAGCLFGTTKETTLGFEGKKCLIGNGSLYTLGEDATKTALELKPSSKLGYVLKATADLFEKMCKFPRRPLPSRTPQHMTLAESIEIHLSADMLPYHMLTIAYAAVLRAENMSDSLKNSIATFLAIPPRTGLNEPLLLATCVDLLMRTCKTEAFLAKNLGESTFINFCNRVALFFAHIALSKEPVANEDITILADLYCFLHFQTSFKLEFLKNFSTDYNFLEKRVKKLNLGEAPREQYRFEEILELDNKASRKASFADWYDAKDRKLTRKGLEFTSGLAAYVSNVLKNIYELKDDTICNACGKMGPGVLSTCSRSSSSKKELHNISICPTCLYGPERFFNLNKGVELCVGAGAAYKVEKSVDIVEGEREPEVEITKTILPTSCGSTLCEIIEESVRRFNTMCTIPIRQHIEQNQGLNTSELIERCLNQDQFRLFLTTMSCAKSLYAYNKKEEAEKFQKTLIPRGNDLWEVFPMAVALSQSLANVLQSNSTQVTMNPKLQALIPKNSVFMILLDLSKHLASLAINFGEWDSEEEISKAALYCESIVRGHLFNLNSLGMYENIKLVPMKTYEEEQEERENLAKEYFKEKDNKGFLKKFFFGK